MISSKSIIKSSAKFIQQKDSRQLKMHATCEFPREQHRTLPKFVSSRQIVLAGLEKQQVKKVQALSLGKSSGATVLPQTKLAVLKRCNKLSDSQIQQDRPKVQEKTVKSCKNIKFKAKEDSDNVFVYTQAATPPELATSSEESGNCCEVY